MTPKWPVLTVFTLIWPLVTSERSWYTHFRNQQKKCFPMICILPRRKSVFYKIQISVDIDPIWHHFDLWWPRKGHDIHIFGISRKNTFQWYVFYQDARVFSIKSKFRSILTPFDPILTSGDLGKVMIYTFSESAEKILSNDMFFTKT